jgi:histone H3/H4
VRIAAVSSAQLEKLSEFDGTPRSTELLLSRNLQDYFAVYQAPVDPEELGRLLRTAEAVSHDYLTVLIRRASRLARGEGAGLLQPGHVRQADGQMLPGQAAGFGEVIFFPAAPQQDQVLVETYDLAALGDTGMAWRVLRAYAADPGPEAEKAPATGDEVVVMLAEAVSAYCLVIFRVAGELAGHAKARYLKTHHLRQAVKEVERRAAMLSTRGTTAVPAPTEPTLFTDRSQAAGIHFRHRTSEWLARFRRYGGRFPTFSGGGVTAGDMNGDGWPDLIFCGGQGCSSFLNRGDGTFRDVTEASGMNVPGEARMSLLVDFDNDGHRDLFITYVNDTNRLFRGRGAPRGTQRRRHRLRLRQRRPPGSLRHQLWRLHGGRLALDHEERPQRPAQPTVPQRGQPDLPGGDRGGRHCGDRLVAGGLASGFR